MAERIIQKRRLRKEAIGDLRDCISIERRSIGAPSFGSASFVESYVQIVETWAKVETKFNARIFDGVAIDDMPSHKFTIRHRDGITSEDRIVWKGDIYKIIRLDNFEGRDEYLELYCAISGDENKEAAK